MDWANNYGLLCKAQIHASCSVVCGLHKSMFCTQYNTYRADRLPEMRLPIYIRMYMYLNVPHWSYYFHHPLPCVWLHSISSVIYTHPQGCPYLCTLSLRMYTYAHTHVYVCKLTSNIHASNQEIIIWNFSYSLQLLPLLTIDDDRDITQLMEVVWCLICSLIKEGRDILCFIYWVIHCVQHALYFEV